MRLNVPKFDPSKPLPEFPVLKTTDEILMFLKNASIENAEQQRKQDRKNTYLVGFSIFIAAVSALLGYFTLVATWQANAANQAAVDATNKQVQLESRVTQLSSQLSAYQSKNDSLSATVESMKSEIERISGK